MSNKFRIPTGSVLADAVSDKSIERGVLDGLPALSRRGFMIGLAGIMLQATAAGSWAATSSSDADTSSTTQSTSDSSSTGFVHPGLLHTQDDFSRMAEMVAAGSSPWIDSWKILIANSTSSVDWVPVPQATIYRGSDGTHAENYQLLYRDIAAAYANALRYKISGDTTHADEAIKIMNAWGSTLTGMGGSSDMCLAAGIYGYEFANAAEIMRDYSGWAAADFAQFQQMMLDVFYVRNAWFLETHSGRANTHYWANWDLCNMASMLAIGVLCDDQDIFNQAVTYFKSGTGTGSVMQSVYFVHDGHLGQWQESGRDQGHATLGLVLMGAFCEMAWNQGLDLYGYENNRFLAGAEYVSKSNLIESGTSYYTMPFTKYNNVDNVNQTALSTSAQGTVRACMALIYNHYVRRKGLAAPYTAKAMAIIAPEGGGGNYGGTSGGYDQLGYGTLTHTRVAEVSGIAPSGLVARTSAGNVILSWWGVAEGVSYNVKRAANDGSYTTIATGISDLLTYTDTTATAGTYQYVVSATTANGETATSDAVTVVTAKQLHTLLKLNETSGDVAADATGNSHEAILSGGFSWTGGRSGNALSLDGSSGFATLPDDITRDLSDFTIAVWVRSDAATTWARIFDFGAGSNQYMTLVTLNGSRKLCFLMTLNTGPGEDVIVAPSALSVGVWTHVAVTLSGSVGSLYVNGALVATNTEMRFAPFRFGATTNNWLGRSQYSGDPYFKGLLEDFRIYHNALSADEVANLASS